jgi:peptidoglycan/xylan/chitin deacetylase (PgdA/CDA1 family)
MKGAGRARRYYHMLRRTFKRGAVILMYHRVVELADDPLQLTVTPAQFVQQMDYIQRSGMPLRLGEVAAALQQRTLPQRAVAVTFDDGYIDNFTEALPVLQTYHVPATIFTVSSKVDTPHEMWWDDLERILLCTPDLPVQLTMEIREQNCAWPTDTFQNRHTAYRALHQVLKPLSIAERQTALEALRRWAGVGQAGRPAYRIMNTNELRQAIGSGVIDIGGHTVNHPRLAALPPEAQRVEIIEGRKQLTQILGLAPTTFAYPYGTPQDFTPETARLVREAGFSAAVTTVHGSVEAGDDVFQLRRMAVHNWDLAEFKWRFERAFVERG